jgi:hypothetical protein
MHVSNNLNEAENLKCNMLQFLEHISNAASH